MDRDDWRFAVLRRLGEREPTVGVEVSADDLRPLRDLVCRDLSSEGGLGRDVVAEVRA